MHNFRNLNQAERKALQEMMKTTTSLKVHQLALRAIQAERSERNAGPDGAIEYVPLTEAYRGATHQ